MNTIADYRRKLNEITEAFFHREGMKKWKQIILLVSQEVLDDAHKNKDVSEMLQHIDLNLL